MDDDQAVRTTVVWCPDWPVVATRPEPDQPVAVVHANRVVAVSAAARADGVARGQRRRDAQSRCPDLIVADRDRSREAQAFEPVLAAIEDVTPLVEIVRPGLCSFPTRGPSRYHGGDAAVMDRLEQVVSAVLGPGATVQTGTADGAFAASLAARHPRRAHRLVEPGASAAFLAELPVALLDAPELTDVFERLGLRTLGQLARLPRADVVARFGPEGLVAHRLACGLDRHPPDARAIPAAVSVTTELDPPVDRVDRAAFAAKSLADDLYDRLDGVGLTCSVLLVVVETEHGERLERRWRHEGSLSPGAVADRVRWQLDGWLSGSAAARPSGGVSRLSLVPESVAPASGRQLGFWGGGSAEAERASRALARVRALLGPDAVMVPEWRGGRDPLSRIAQVPVDAVDLDAPRPAAQTDWVTEPWPGRLPAPSPATVYAEPRRAELVDVLDRPVTVSGRGVASAAPHRLVVGGGAPVEVVAWAGPWPLDERWWDPATHRRQARMQVVTLDGTARLLVLEAGRWSVAGVYD
ncbi:MAG: DNA polymerase Y family protein [Acidimicrobiales bacterium]